MQNENVATIYVSQYGEKGCIKSVEAALLIVAQMRKSGDMQPVTIRITDEIYHVTKPIIIRNNVRSVTIEPKTKTLISGGIRINGFVKDTFHGAECLSVDLSSYGDLKFTDFYVNGKAALMPKYPEEGTLDAQAVENPIAELPERSKWFIVKEKDFDVIKDFSNLEDSIISFNHLWVDEHTPIQSVDREKRKITFGYRSRFSISMDDSRYALNYIIENVPEMFGKPNEWYYDRPSKKLYYIPESTEIKAEDIVGFIPVTDKIFCVNGTDNEKVQDITVRNFDIAYTKGDYRSVADKDGKISCDEVYASDPQAVCNAHGGIEIENAYSCSVENCNLYCFGVHCIVVKDGSRNIRITGNTIQNIGAGAIVVSGGAIGSEPNTHTYGNTISQNRIFHCGRRYFSACGILLKHTYDNTVSHNEIGYLYYTGISCGWVWGYADSICHHILIEKNHIHHLGLGKLSDMGGVYLLGKQPGTVVRGNLIHDIKSKTYGGWAIYTDEGSRYILIENNVCYHTSEAPYHQHYGTMNTVRNNIFAFGGEYAIMYTKREHHAGIIAENNILVSKGKPIVNTAFSPEEDGGDLNEVILNCNLIFDTESETPTVLQTEKREYTLSETQESFGMGTDSMIANPEFVDMANNDFRLKETSPAYMIGFQDIDVSDVGCAKEAERSMPKKVEEGSI